MTEACLPRPVFWARWLCPPEGEESISGANSSSVGADFVIATGASSRAAFEPEEYFSGGTFFRRWVRQPG